jgi:hypothetical protein
MAPSSATARPNASLSFSPDRRTSVCIVWRSAVNFGTVSSAVRRDIIEAAAFLFGADVLRMT